MGWGVAGIYKLYDIQKMPINKDLLEFYHKFRSIEYNRCLSPKRDCKNNAIRAHSIQSSSALNLIQQNDHVIRIGHRTDKNHIPIILFQSVGVNMASTFKGLCSYHDNILFEPLEKRVLEWTEEQLFLIAYRAVLKELHTCILRSIKLQLAYQKKVDLKIISGTDYSREGIIAGEYLMVAYETGQYKEILDNALMERNYDCVKHIKILLKTSPTITCSQMFSVDSIKVGDDVLRIVLSVIPIDRSTSMVIISSMESEYELAKEYCLNCMNKQENFSKYSISKLILKDCENFFINPAYFNSWSTEKKNIISEFFLKSYLEGADYDSKEFYLFGN